MKQLVINNSDALKIRDDINKLLTTLSPNNESSLETVLTYTTVDDISCSLDYDSDSDEVTCVAIRKGATYIEGLNCVVTDDCGLILNLYDRFIYISPEYVEAYFTEDTVTIPRGTTYYNVESTINVESDSSEHPVDLVTIY